MNCPSGGFPSIRHNEVRDLTSAFLSEVCHNVHTEPTLQPLQGEHLKYKSANGEVGARLDVAAQNFWGKDHQTAYFDVRIFNPFAQSYANSSMSKCYRKHELDKREYEERVREIEHGSFSPLIFSTAGGMGPKATTVYKKIASLIADKRQEPYSTTLFWLRCKLSFSLLSLSNHVPSRNQVISFPLTTPFYSFGLCRGKGPLNNFSIGLVFIIYLITFLFCIFILYPLCIIIIAILFCYSECKIGRYCLTHFR